MDQKTFVVSLTFRRDRVVNVCWYRCRAQWAFKLFGSNGAVNISPELSDYVNVNTQTKWGFKKHLYN